MTEPRGRALIVTLGRSRGSLAASRACRPTHVVPRPRGDGSDFVAGVRAAIEQAGLAAPRTVVADEDTIAGWEGPVVVKCRAHGFPGQDLGPRIEARRYPDIAAAGRRIETIKRAGFDAILQAPVDGELSALIGPFADVTSALRLLPRSQTSVWSLRDPGPTLDLLRARGKRMVRAPRT